MEEIELKEFRNYYKSPQKYNEYVGRVEKIILSKVLNEEIEDFSEEINHQMILSTLISTFNEYIYYLINSLPSSNELLKQSVKINNLLINEIVKIKKLCEDFEIDLMKLTSFIMSNSNVRALNINIQKAFNRDIHEGLELYLGALAPVSNDLLSDIDMDKLVNIYDHPKKLALALSTFILNEINNAIYLEAKADGLIHSNYGKIRAYVNDDTLHLELLKPIGFKLKYDDENSYYYFRNLYKKLVVGPIYFVDSKTTSVVSFTEVLLSKNILQTLDKIYFTVDRYQICYILVHKLSNYYKGDFEKVIVESELFFKKPFGGSKPLPLTQRDINDYKNNYIGHKAKIGNKYIKNYGIIDAIFVDLR